MNWGWQSVHVRVCFCLFHQSRSQTAESIEQRRLFGSSLNLNFGFDSAGILNLPQCVREQCVYRQQRRHPLHPRVITPPLVHPKSVPQKPMLRVYAVCYTYTQYIGSRNSRQWQQHSATQVRPEGWENITDVRTKAVNSTFRPTLSLPPLDARQLVRAIAHMRSPFYLIPHNAPACHPVWVKLLVSSCIPPNTAGMTAQIHTQDPCTAWCTRRQCVSIGGARTVSRQNSGICGYAGNKSKETMPPSPVLLAQWLSVRMIICSGVDMNVLHGVCMLRWKFVGRNVVFIERVASALPSSSRRRRQL